MFFVAFALLFSLLPSVCPSIHLPHFSPKKLLHIIICYVIFFLCFCLLGFSAPFVMSMSFFLDAFGNPFSYFPSFFHPHLHGLRTKFALHKTNKKFFSPQRSLCLFLFVKMTFPLSTQSVLSSISTHDSFSYFLFFFYRFI